MSKFVKSAVLVISILVVAVLVAGCSSRFVPQREEGAYPTSPSSSSSFNQFAATLGAFCSGFF